MTTTNRRSFLGAGALAVGALSMAGATAPASAAPGTRTGNTYRSVTANSDQYLDLCQGTNLRWSGTPKRIAFPRDAAEVATELRNVLSSRLKPAVRSGGHCYEDFVSNPSISAIIDLSAITQVRWDTTMGAFEIGAGAQLGAVYQLLYKQWGVYAPGGNCPTVAAGGHIAGGGYGAFNRRDGLISDHLHAVEVVFVDHRGKVKSVVATDSPEDPHHDLWWAYTGGGGGNFGVAVRYWLRSPGAAGSPPERALPTPPKTVWLSTVSWDWDAIDEARFVRLLDNHGRWHEAHSGADAPESGLFSQLKTWHRSNGQITMDTLMDADVPGAEAILQGYVDDVSAGIPRATVHQHRQVPWMQATQWQGFTGLDSTRRFDGKSAYLRKNYTPEMAKAAYRHLVREDFDNAGALLMLASYGGSVNSLAPTDRACAQRDSIIKMQVVSIWDDAADDDANVDWTRNTYHDIFSATGGVPVPNEVTDGCFINYCDTDLDDPSWNTSGRSAHELYYKENLTKLKEIRRRYDSRGVLQHAQSLPFS